MGWSIWILVGCLLIIVGNIPSLLALSLVALPNFTLGSVIFFETFCVPTEDSVAYVSFLVQTFNPKPFLSLLGNVQWGNSWCLLGFLLFSGLYAPGPINSLVPTFNLSTSLFDFSPKK